jgi:iron(III) transport system permease protein
VFVLPVAQLVAWSLETIADGTTVPNLRDAAWNTLLLGAVTAAVAPAVAMVLVYGMRVHGSRTNRFFTRLSTLGYAIPGTVIAVAVYVPLVWIDRRFVDIADSVFDRSIDLVFTGSIIGLVFAYLVRFNALSFLATESRMQHVDPRLDDAARSLGADRARVLADVHLPLLRPGLIAGALLVLVEVMKELPATALLRPLGRDTLAITVWEATKDSRLDAAALPALLIVLVGLVPVIVLVRLLRSEGWASAADRFG